MKIYLLGIAGTGMGSFAGLLRAAGHEVSGSDENVYPPMSDKLADWRIQTFTPYSAANLDKAKPDMAVVGNVIRADNPKLLACDITEGHLSSTLPHLANISYRVGRALVFDGAKETFVNDKEADRLLTRESYRKGFEIPKSFT